jgi:CDP-glucose 4,6-dehydratase
MEGLGMNALRAFYKNKKVFVTGHTGFKGAWLSALLNWLGATVRGYALEPERTHDLYNLIDGDALVDSTIADIRDYDSLWRAVTLFEPDIVIHLAAQSLVLRAHRQPRETYEVNVMGTVNLLETMRGYNHDCLVLIVTTDKIYDNTDEGKVFVETDRLGGHEPYASSKACCELVVEAYRNVFFSGSDDGFRKTVASARSGNVIGGGDWSDDRIIPDMIKALTKGEPVMLRNPHSVRPWQFVLEPLAGYLQLLQRMHTAPKDFSGAFNFGPSPQEMLSVEDLVTRAIAIWGSGSMTTGPKSEAMEAAHLLISSEKAHHLVGWKPVLNADETIRLTVEWYRSNDPKTVTMSQIENYLQRL